MQHTASDTPQNKHVCNGTIKIQVKKVVGMKDSSSNIVSVIDNHRDLSLIRVLALG